MDEIPPVPIDQRELEMAKKATSELRTGGNAGLLLYIRNTLVQ